MKRKISRKVNSGMWCVRYNQELCRHNKGGNSQKVKWGGKLSRSEAMNLCRKLNFTNPEGKERGRYRD